MATRLYSFLINSELDAALKRVKARDGIAESVQIRRALTAWFKTKGVSLTPKPARKRGTR